MTYNSLFYYLDSIQEKMGCRLPWNKGNNSLQNCSTADHLKQFWTIAEHMMYSGENRYYQMTGCEQPCDYYFYRAKQVNFCSCLNTPETVCRVSICPRGNLPCIQNYPINGTVFSLICPVG